MIYSLPTATIIADSVSPLGIRLTTFQVRIHKFVLQEITRHRMLSFSSASTRARPISWVLDQVRNDPAMPLSWGKNQKGMQAAEELSRLDREDAEIRWLQLAEEACHTVESLQRIGLHKQTANRLLEPWMWADVVVSGTDWGNFFNLRCHPAAQPELRVAAEAMRKAMKESVPAKVEDGQWHLPYISVTEWEALESLDLCKLSIARCARVSVKPHDSENLDGEKDIDLCDRLRLAGHLSPFEHAATPCRHPGYVGNFRGWLQYRKTIPGESVFRLSQQQTTGG